MLGLRCLSQETLLPCGGPRRYQEVSTRPVISWYNDKHKGDTWTHSYHFAEQALLLVGVYSNETPLHARQDTTLEINTIFQTYHN